MNLDYSLTSDHLFHLIGDGITLGSLGCSVKRKGSLTNEVFTLLGEPKCAGKDCTTFAGKLGDSLSLTIRLDRLQPNALAFLFSIVNHGTAVIELESLVLPELILNNEAFPIRSPLWTLQGASVGWGQDFAFELPIPYTRENYLGHLQDAEGGGTPINYFWNSERGLAIMHIEPVPQEWYTPVQADGKEIRTSLEKRSPTVLQPNQEMISPRVVVSLHHGDFFEPVSLYRELISEQGCAPAQPTSGCFEPAWCSWGYEFDVTPDQMLGVIPMLKKLGIHWLTLDDRWFDTYGDWRPRADTFPRGIEDIRKMNEQIHAAGAKSQIWWYPLCAEDGDGSYDSHKYVVSRILQEHPEWVVRHKDGSVARNNRHLAMLCPALPEVQEYTRILTKEFIQDWDFDGHKLDNIFTMPACYNPAHHHLRPEESIEAFAKVYGIIFETTRRIKPDSVTQICPCGTPLTHSLIPYVDQTVTADPTSSLQIRQRIKFYKALMGPRAAVFADHVELSDGGVDFASEIGPGGVPATKFIYPEDQSLKGKLQEYWDLPDEKQKLWKQWFDLYRQHQPATGEYLNLYDSAFDAPETHVIRKDRRYYFAFYAPQYAGPVELRGLVEKRYVLFDMVSGKKYGVVSVNDPILNIQFSGALLLFADPIED
jgi:alpha-galactosidase